MPMKRELYPPNWNDISLRIRERAGNKCEHCGVANGAIGARDKYGAWHDEHSIHSMNAGYGDALFGEFPDMTKIVLTVHHIGIAKPDGTPGDPEDKMDCRDENLTALCQSCHFAADRPHNIVKRRVTRLRQKAERIAATGQASLFGSEVNS